MSKKRPDQHKLVGRLTVNLAEIANELKYVNADSHKLEYCSVNGSLIFNAKILGKKASGLSPDNFDKDSFSDYQSFLAHHPNLGNISTRTKPKGQGHTSLSQDSSH